MQRVMSALILVIGLLVPGVAGAEDVGALDVGESVFWNGPFVEASGPGSVGSAPAFGFLGTALCNPTISCYAYELDLAAGGARLRVAVDHPSLDDTFGLELRAPDGSVAASDDGVLYEGLPPVFTGGSQLSEELFVSEPAEGRWTVTVVATDVLASGFRVRAKLEGPQAPSEEGTLLYPNIRSIPPFQVNFGTCYEDPAVTRCLRFSQGPANAGEGPLDLFVRRGDLGSPQENARGQLTLRGAFFQRVHRTDGEFLELPAGEFEYHFEHGHYHHTGTGGYELFRVDGVELVPAGVSAKQGFCMGDYGIDSWGSFTSEPHRGTLDYLGGENCTVPTPGATQMGLEAGWFDIYSHTIAGQYIDFGTNPDGDYIIRATADADGTLHESDPTDNVSYALIRVAGTDVTVLERGRGTDHLDPNKVVVVDGRPPALSDPKCVPGGPCPS